MSENPIYKSGLSMWGKFSLTINLAFLLFILILIILSKLYILIVLTFILIYFIIRKIPLKVLFFDDFITVVYFLKKRTLSYKEIKCLYRSKVSPFADEIIVLVSIKKYKIAVELKNKETILNIVNFLKEKGIYIIDKKEVAPGQFK